ncbi:multidrug effflux MFS transporter [Devosia sp.]|uniref:multidrug effflux MFS transporter n=1 Tax=Devosia sp. TaxID=1871048 RepID=UPI003BABA753
MSDAVAPPALPLRTHGLRLTLLLSLLLGFASISTDLYLPALPTMGRSLGAAQGTLELTVSGYLLGFAIGQLFWGPLSDRLGRKLPLLLGVGIFVLGAAGCALSSDATQLIVWRIVQALGASAAVVLARAMVRDLFHRDEAARKLSTLMMIMGIAPMIGPSLGAQILTLSSWQMIFWLLVMVGFATALGVFRTDETLAVGQRAQQSLLQSFSVYLVHLRNWQLMAHAGILGFSAAGIFAYVAGSSFVFISYFGLSPQAYGFVFASGIVGIMLANALNRRIVGRFGSTRMVLVGTIIGAGAGLFLIVETLTGWGGIFGFGALLFVFVAMNGLVGANAIAGGLSSVTEGTGAASALLGCAQYGGGMMGSALIGFMANGTPVPMAVIIAGGSLAAVGCASYLARNAIH